MKELLLVSNGLGAFPHFAGKAGEKIAFIPTASNLDKDTWYVDKDRDYLRDQGHTLIEFDLNGKTESDVRSTLEGVDLVYVAGGNTFYLLEKAQQSGFSVVLPGLLSEGLKYVGASAGAIVVGPSLEPVQSLDDPSVVNLSSLDGLKLVDFVVLPHFTERNETYQKVVGTYEDRFQLVKITDDQAIAVRGTDYEVIESLQSPAEIS